jgi:hypothetical protein
MTVRWKVQRVVRAVLPQTDPPLYAPLLYVDHSFGTTDLALRSFSVACALASFLSDWNSATCWREDGGAGGWYCCLLAISGIYYSSKDGCIRLWLCLGDRMNR